jgi:AcrR family transcriptional regulator
VAPAGGELVIASRARPRSRRGEGDRLRKEILDTTAQLLATTGDEEAVSIRAVASAVGVTPPSIYLHFADKDELIRAACEETFQLCDRFVEGRVAGIDDPAAQLAERGRAYIDFGIRHPEHYRVLFMGKAQVYEDDALLQASGFVHLLDNVTRCMEAGAIARQDPVVVATGLWTLVHGITSLAVSVPGYPVVGLDALVDHMLDAYARGLAGS